MATTYSIYFENNYTSTQNYAFFRAAPITTATVGKPKVFSNVFLSNSVANGANWTIDISETFYAWCGVAPQTLAPGVTVINGSGRLATLGTATSPGSTWTMYNNGGSPALKDPPTYTSSPGAFEIDTATDFFPNQNFLIGLGAVDSNGRMKPAATMEAPRNGKVNILPVTKFYISSYDYTTGTIIDTSTVANEWATIDFSSNPGLFGATVKQLSNGEFTVQYYNQSAFSDIIASKAAGPGPTVSLDPTLVSDLRNALRTVLSLLDTNGASGGDFVTNSWICSLQNVSGSSPTQNQRNEILASLSQYMIGKEYSYNKVFTWDTQNLQMTFGKANTNKDKVLNDWTAAFNALVPRLQGFLETPSVQGANVAEDEDLPDQPFFEGKQGLNRITGSGGHRRAIEA